MTRIESNPIQLQSHIDFFREKGTENRAARRLFVVFSRSFAPSDHPLTVADSFRVCEMTCCFGAQALFDEKTTYCGIPLPCFNGRESHVSHELIPRRDIVFELPSPPYDGHTSNPPFTVGANCDAKDIVKIITAIIKGNEDDKTAKVLPWLAGLQAANCALLLVAYVNITPEGVYIKAQVGSFAAKLGELNVSTRALPAAIPVAAAVYFIGWRTLAQWLLARWDAFLSFLSHVWKFIKDKFDNFMELILAVIKNWLRGQDSPSTTCIPLLPIN